MATSEILGLFTTPQQYEQQRQAAMEAQALQMAKLSPMEQGQFGIALGAQQLGRAIGGALGGEDPQLKIISQRQALAGQLDPSNPESYMKVAQIAAQSGDQQFAIAVADAGRQAAVQVAQANKERQLAVPVDIQKAQMIPQIQDALDQYKALPQSPERDRAIRILENQLKVLVGEKATNIAAPLQVANRLAEITKLQANLDPASQDYKILQAEKEQLQRPEKPAAIASELQVAERLRQISIAQRSLPKDSPEYQDLEVERLQLQKAGKVDKPYEFEVKAEKLTKLKEDLRKAETAPNPDKEAIQKLRDNIQAIEGTQKRPTEEIFDLMAELDVLDPVKDKKKYDIVQARIDKLTKGKSLEESLGEGLGMLGKALAAGQKKEFEETGKYTAENFKNLGSAVAAGTASKRNIATLETSLENAFTGKFSEGKEAIVGALISLGIPVGSDLKNATSNTQLIQAMGTRYIFPLVKNYPGSLAAKELASLEKTAPNALQQPETIKRLVGLLKVDLAENEYTYNRAKEYKRANKESLIGFNEADQRIEFQNKLGRLQELVTNVKRKKSKTPQEDAEINQLKKELYIGG